MKPTGARRCAGALLLALCLTAVTACGDDSDSSSRDDGTSQSQTSGETGMPDVDKALEAVGDDLATITAEQLVGKFGFTGFAMDGERIVMANSGDSSMAETNCTEAGLVFSGVGVDNPYSIKYADGTVGCEEFTS